MIKIAALLVAALVLAVSIPAAADGVPREKRPVAAKKIKKHRVARRKPVTEAAVVEQNQTPPVVLAPAPLAAPVPPPLYIWAPGHWTWSSPMMMHVWVPGMYVDP